VEIFFKGYQRSKAKANKISQLSKICTSLVIMLDIDAINPSIESALKPIGGILLTGC
jgi:hypothetical protein